MVFANCLLQVWADLAMEAASEMEAASVEVTLGEEAAEVTEEEAGGCEHGWPLSATFSVRNTKRITQSLPQYS